MRSFIPLLALALVGSLANSLTMKSSDVPSRRTFLSRTVSTTAAVITGSTIAAQNSMAATPEIFTTPRGIKYAILKPAKMEAKPQKGAIVAIEYTGYLTDGSIFDGTYAEGQSKVLVFELGGNAVIEGINEIVMQMGVGEKVQAIIPPELAFGDKGLCLETGECLIKPKATLVYDVYLKKSAIPPP
jgi:FKBP-type peptidyl-prolyl cis-trans isomerase